MTGEFIARVRQEQTQQQLQLTCEAIEREVQEFIDNDVLGLHRTQLQRVQSVLQAAGKALRSNLNVLLQESHDVQQVYALCREYDEAIVWLQKLWNYLKEKFGQRREIDGNSDLPDLLKAADEVVWSCFHGVLQKALGQHGPAPLAYVEPEYSPATIQIDQPLPVDLTLKADLDFMNGLLESLPIPVLRLPPACISAPWWLVFVAHEVGHHVQYALNLVGYYREGLAAAAESQGFSKDEAAGCWGRWGEEIFADFFSLMLMGQWALRAIAEVEAGTSEQMVERKSTYPSPVIRLALMKCVAEELGLDVKQAVLGLDLKAIAETDEVAKKDYTVVEDAVLFALKPEPKFGNLKDICSFDKAMFADVSKISGWSNALSSKADLPVDRRAMAQLETARHIACGSLRAWSKHSDQTESADLEKDYKLRKENRETIRLNTIKALLLSGPRDTRAGGPEEAVDSEKAGKSLADLLRSAGRRTPPGEKGEKSGV
jgi:hypothetical protein